MQFLVELHLKLDPGLKHAGMTTCIFEGVIDPNKI